MNKIKLNFCSIQMFGFMKVKMKHFSFSMINIRFQTLLNIRNKSFKSYLGPVSFKGVPFLHVRQISQYV